MPLAMDTINTTDVQGDGETMVSSGGNFVLGFFSLEGNSRNRYMGIWYKKVTVQTVVWVANRGTPLANASGLLRVIRPGILVLSDEGDGIIWSTNTLRTVRNPVAQLLDSGNLVVRDAEDYNPDDFLWQSFDHPTDTLLPGMKLGWNFTARKEVYLSSWRTDDDPATGNYTFHCDPRGYPQNIIKKGEDEQFRSGPWNGVSFSGALNLKKNSIFRFELVKNKNEVYYEYELLNSSISRFKLSSSGVAQRWTWVDRTKTWVVSLTAPIDNCDKYGLCSAYGSCNISDSAVCGCLNKFIPKDADGWEREDWSNGCVRRTALNCQHGDGFIKYTGIKLPDTKHSWYNESMNLEECKVLCLKNCSCMAYSNPNITGGAHGCLLWFDDLIDIKALPADGQYIYIRMASSEIDSKGSRKEILIVILLIVLGIVLVGLTLTLYNQRRKRTLRDQLRERGGDRQGYASNYIDESHKNDVLLPLLDFNMIMKATDNFSIDNKLGEGGFGPVYKGVLEDGQEVAVKRLSRTSLQGVDEFKNEVICIAKLQHRNLVKLLGCCIQGEENLLVYEYMTNKSLDLVLFDGLKSKILDWSKRFDIINGIARGLLYLHQDSRLRIIHRDLKASNILLDSDMNPKISDFGLARAFGGDETGANTRRVVGTYGYMSPEYAIDGLFSLKSDVFSFGVLVLEIISGKRNRGFSHRDHNLNLVGHAWMLYKEGRSLELVDSYLGDSSHLSEVLRSIHVGLLCVQQCPEDRPSMSSVVLMLANEGVLPEAKQPGFFAGRDVSSNAETSASSNALTSTNEISITILEPR